MRTTLISIAATGAAVALGTALVPSAAFAAEGDVTITGDTYTKVIFDHAVKGLDGEKWVAECPPEFPYLSTYHSEPDKPVGHGLHITEETPSALHVVQGGLFDPTLGPTWLTLENGTVVATGNSGTVSNWSPVLQHLTIKMECTDELSKAWVEAA